MSEPVFFTAPAALLPDLARTLAADWTNDENLLVTLAVTPSAAVGRSLVQAVTRETGSTAGLRAVTLPDLAREMAAPLLERWIMPPRADRVITAHMLSEDAGPDGDLALRLPVAAALARSLRDLRESGIETLPAEEILGDLSGGERFRFEHIGRMFRRFSSHLDRHGLADDAALYRAALEGPVPNRAHRLLVYGIYDLTGLQRELLARLAERVDVTWLCPGAPEGSAAAEITDDLRDWAESRGFALRRLEQEEAPSRASGLPPSRASGPVAASGQASMRRILACPGLRAEAREVARDVLCAANEGFDFGEMAVILSSKNDQELLLREEFAKAGIPVTGRASQLLLDQPRGRALRALCLLAGGDADRGDVAAVLRAALEAEDRPEVPPANVPLILRMAGCGAVNRRRWAEQLRRLVKGLSRSDQPAEDDPPEEAQLAQGRLEADHVRVVARRVDALLARVEQFRKTLQSKRPRPWRELAHDLVALAAQAGLRADGGGELFEAARDAASQLKGWDRLGLVPRADLALELWLENMLERQRTDTSPGGDSEDVTTHRPLEGLRGGAGVLLLDINQARGLQVRAAWLTGLTHELFSPPGRQDPLLSDQLRRKLARATGCLLRSSADRFRERDLLFELGLAAGRERLVLSWPRLDEGSGQVRLPVDPLAALIESISGPIDSDDPAASEAVVRTPAHPPGPDEDAGQRPCLRLDEYDQATIRSGLPERMAHLQEDIALARALRADRARFASESLNDYTGIVGDDAPEIESLSVTGAETLARSTASFARKPSSN